MHAVFQGLTTAPQPRQALVYGGGIAALARGLRAAASDADRLGWLIPLVSLDIHNPSHSCTTQILAAGVAPDVLQQLAGVELTFGSLIVTFFERHCRAARLVSCTGDCRAGSREPDTGPA